MRKIYLCIEFLGLFFAMPLAVNYNLSRGHMLVIPVLLLAAMLCLGLLIRDPSFDRSRLWNLPGLRLDAKRIVMLFLAVSVAMAAGVYFLDRESLLMLPREYPLIWCLIMIFYPLVSVYPQEIIYRAFLFHRYEPILPTPGFRMIASAVVFGFVHIVFGNLLAVVLTLAAGLLFAVTYHRTRSLAAVFVEHSLYGCAIFTVGLGAYFFHGTRLLMERIAGGG